MHIILATTKIPKNTKRKTQKTVNHHVNPPPQIVNLQLETSYYQHLTEAIGIDGRWPYLSTHLGRPEQNGSNGGKRQG